jgi:AcrR family transcriptional regulator
MAVPALSGTQAAILAAYAELIEEVGSDDVSYRLVARRAGIAERTVFRNYPTRVDLLLATAAWIEATVFAREESHSIFDIPSRSATRCSGTTPGRSSRTSSPRRQCAA